MPTTSLIIVIYDYVSQHFCATDTEQQLNIMRFLIFAKIFCFPQHDIPSEVEVRYKMSKCYCHLNLYTDAISVVSHFFVTPTVIFV